MNSLPFTGSCLEIQDSSLASFRTAAERGCSNGKHPSPPTLRLWVRCGHAQNFKIPAWFLSEQLLNELKG
ncbi:hypothetical protein KY289_000185 [Solanum tuberosum]|nr:hypothetical protein KY289_000185 [Solanum tuberosum]